MKESNLRRKGLKGHILNVVDNTTTLLYMRKSISKKIRQAVYDKFDGHCAYCGCKLEFKDLRVDHINPVYKSEINGDIADDSIDNYNPSCRSCNFYKSTFGIEQFRENVQNKLIKKLHRDFNYKMLVKYGLIKEDFKPIEFYFEKPKK